jgi:hypothetical protein
MDIERIKSVQDAGGGRYRCIIRFAGEAQDDIFWSDPRDNHGAGPLVRWLIATLQFDGDITPYVRPPPTPRPPTLEEQLEALSARLNALERGRPS